jgi:hypothetical protein
LDDNLRKKNEDSESPWIIVRFNAWQQQKVGPTWWALMNAVLRQGTRQLLWDHPLRWVSVRASDLLWRVSLRSWQYIIALIFIGVALRLLSGYASAADLAENKNLVHLAVLSITLLAGLYNLIVAVTRTMLPSSSRAAETFTEVSSDPMRWIADHFASIVRGLKEPTAIFIDDLDRCHEDYVVELLEGIQTLYRTAQLVWVVAADRRWLCNSFETVYEKFGSAIEESGQRLGYLFLEKIFQLSASLPRMSDNIKKRFWSELLSGEIAPAGDVAATEAEARREVQEITSAAGLLEAAGKRTSGGLADLAYRAAVAERIMDADVQEGIEHRLLPYAPLIERNPRSMKRLINAYGIQLAVVALAGASVDRGAMALWTIISLRWPVLAEELERHPDRLSLVGEKDENRLKIIPRKLHLLLQSAALERVVSGDASGVDAQLTVENLKEILSLRTDETSQPMVA